MSTRQRLIILCVCLVSLLVAGCGSSGNGESSGSRNQDNTIVDTNEQQNNIVPNQVDVNYSESTTLILAYMSITHGQEMSSFENDEEMIDHRLAAQGLFGSGHHISSYKENVIGHIDTFLDFSLQYVRQTAASRPIDNKSIAQSLLDYQAKDIAYIKEYTNSHIGSFAPALVGQVVSDLTISINNLYSIALLELSTI